MSNYFQTLKVHKNPIQTAIISTVVDDEIKVLIISSVSFFNLFEVEDSKTLTGTLITFMEVIFFAKKSIFNYNTT